MLILPKPKSIWKLIDQSYASPHLHGLMGEKESLLWTNKDVAIGMKILTFLRSVLWFFLLEGCSHPIILIAYLENLCLGTLHVGWNEG